MDFKTTGYAALAGVVFFAIVAGHWLDHVDHPHTHRDAYHALEPSRRAPVAIVTSLGSVWPTSFWSTTSSATIVS